MSFPDDYSPNEIKIIEYFGAQDMARSSSMGPPMLYTLLASLAVSREDYGPYTRALGRALQSLSKINRMTSEFEQIIAVRDDREPRDEIRSVLENVLRLHVVPSRTGVETALEHAGIEFHKVVVNEPGQGSVVIRVDSEYYSLELDHRRVAKTLSRCEDLLSVQQTLSRLFSTDRLEQRDNQLYSPVLLERVDWRCRRHISVFNWIVCEENITGGCTLFIKKPEHYPQYNMWLSDTPDEMTGVRISFAEVDMYICKNSLFQVNQCYNLKTMQSKGEYDLRTVPSPSKGGAPC